MSILIKDISMPKVTTALVVTRTGRVSIFNECNIEKRMVGAVEIPSPHGRLMDADALIKKLREMAQEDWNPYTFINLSDAIQMIISIIEEQEKI